jgi:membrane protease YdiL (CAAX protease family)
VISEKPWRPEAVLMLGAGILAVVSLSGIGTALLQEKDETPRFVAFAVGTLLWQCLAALQVHFFLRYHGMGWRDFLGLRRRRAWVMVLLGFAIALVAAPVGAAAMHVSSKAVSLVQEDPKPQMAVEVLEAATGTAQRILFAFTAIVMAPLVEETMFRGILYPLLKQQGYRRLALFGTSLLFAAIHMNLLIFFPLFLFALLLVTLYEWTDSLIAPMAAHAAFNAINFLLLLNWRTIDHWFDPHP